MLGLLSQQVGRNTEIVSNKAHALPALVKDLTKITDSEQISTDTGNADSRQHVEGILLRRAMYQLPKFILAAASDRSGSHYSHTTTVNGMLNGSWEYPVFNYPQQAIARNMFLNLEPYKKNFHYTHWDKLTSVILEAGKYRGEQYVVPMSYTLPITLFKKQNIQHIHSIDMTWDNMIDETIELRIAAVANSSVHSGNAFFPLVKENEDELTFSEEELFDFIKKKEER